MPNVVGLENLSPISALFDPICLVLFWYQGQTRAETRLADDFQNDLLQSCKTCAIEAPFTASWCGSERV